MTRRVVALLAILPFLRPLLRALTCRHEWDSEAVSYRLADDPVDLWHIRYYTREDGRRVCEERNELTCLHCGMVAEEKTVWLKPAPGDNRPTWDGYIQDSVWRTRFTHGFQANPEWLPGFHYPA